SKSEIVKTTVEEIITGTAGKYDTEDNTWVVDTAQPQVAKVDLPKLPTKDATPIDIAEAKEGPKGTLHRLRIIEGDKERVVEYWLDDEDEVIRHEVTRTELAAPSPQVQRPAQTPAQPAPRPSAQPKD